MGNGILNGNGNDFGLFDPVDPTKQLRVDISAVANESIAIPLYPSVGGSPYFVVASTEGNAGDFLKSGGGSGSTNLWESPSALGLPQIVASSNLTSQGAALGPTTIFAVPASGAGRYRINWTACIVTAATVSSTLGGTNGFQVIWTNTTDSVAKTSNPTTTTTRMTSAGNTTATTTSGVHIARCKASTNLQYQFDYTSAGGTAMAYDIFIFVEFLG